jgi:hypothetical protein
MKLGDAVPGSQCGHCFKARLSATAEGSKTRCPRRGVVFRGKGNELAHAQRAIDDLTKSFRRLGGG